jgi:hypothetical protein
MTSSPPITVEPAETAESRRHGDVSHRHVRLMDQLLGKQDPTSLGNGDRRGTEVVAKKATKVPLADPQSTGQGVDVVVIQSTHLDQRQRPRHCV